MIFDDSVDSIGNSETDIKRAFRSEDYAQVVRLVGNFKEGDAKALPVIFELLQRCIGIFNETYAVEISNKNYINYDYYYRKDREMQPIFDACCSSIVKIGDESAIPQLASILETRNILYPTYRAVFAVAETLESLVVKYPDSIHRDRVLGIFRRLSHDRDFRSLGYRALGRMRDTSAVPDMIEWLQKLLPYFDPSRCHITLDRDSDPLIGVIIRALGEVKDDSAVPALSKLFETKWPILWVWTIDALSNIGSEAAFEKYQPALDTPHTEIRENAVAHLCRFGPIGVKRLAMAFDDKEKIVQETAVYCLGYMEPKVALPLAYEAIRRPWHLWRTVREIIGGMDEEKLLTAFLETDADFSAAILFRKESADKLAPMLEAALKSDRESVRLNATKVIRELGNERLLRLTRRDADGALSEGTVKPPKNRMEALTRRIRGLIHSS